jgi:type VI secretion system protein ImpF
MLTMAKNRQGQQPMVPSLMDRLLVDRRGKRTLSDVRKFIARDLEDLLNTRCRCELLPEEMSELHSSIVNYGLPDFTGVKMSGVNERKQLSRLLEDSIRRYESRLLSVRVTLVDSRDESDRRLHFRIDAILNVHPTPTPVVFDSHLEPSSSTFKVE